MKQIRIAHLSTVFLMMMVLILAACKAEPTETAPENDNNEPAQEEAATETNEGTESTEGTQGNGSNETYTIGISLPAADHGWMGAVIENAEEEAKKHSNIEYRLVTSTDPATQTSDIDDLITQGVDAIVMLPIESAAMTQVADKVAEAGIELIVVDRGLHTENFRTYIGGDNYGIGWVDAEYLVQELIERNGEPVGKVAEIIGVPSTVTDLRKQGFRDYIEKYPGIEIIASQPGEFTREAALKAMENILLANDEIDAVFSHDDDMTVGIVQAIKDAQREDEMFIVSSAGMKEIYKMMMDGSKPEVVVSVSYSPTMSGIGVYLATQILQNNSLEGFWGQKVPKNIVLEATPVTPENVEQYYDPNANF